MYQHRTNTAHRPGDGEVESPRNDATRYGERDEGRRQTKQTIGGIIGPEEEEVDIVQLNEADTCSEMQ